MLTRVAKAMFNGKDDLDYNEALNVLNTCTTMVIKEYCKDNAGNILQEFVNQLVEKMNLCTCPDDHKEEHVSNEPLN